MTLEQEAIRDKKRAKRIETAQMSAQGLLKRCFSGKCSPRTAIKGMCMECVGFDRGAITECTAYACPLWEFRPFQDKSETD